jgi:hypothetical protein
MAILATVVDWGALGKSVAAAFIVGVSVCLAFSLAIYGTTRVADHSRAERPLAAMAAGVLATIGAAVCIGAIVLGIIVMTSK